MDVGLGGSPSDAGLVDVGRQIEKRHRSEPETVIRTGLLVEAVSYRRANAKVEEKLVDRIEGLADTLEWTAARLVHIGRHQRIEPLGDIPHHLVGDKAQTPGVGSRVDESTRDLILDPSR
jgi:hypothetical protein